MAEFPAMPLFTDAYLADTRHLSTLEHGAYLLLLMEAWRRPTCSLPDDDAMLARLAGMHVDDWIAIRSTVLDLWIFDGRSKVWTQKRLKKEREYVRGKSRVQSDNATRRWKGGKKGDAAALPNECQNDATDDAKKMPEGMPNACQNDAPTPTPIRENIQQPPVTETARERSKAEDRRPPADPFLVEVMAEAEMTVPPSDGAIFSDWRKLGADDKLILKTVRAVTAQVRDRGGRMPFKLKFFDDAIRQAVAEDDRELQAMKRSLARAKRVEEEDRLERERTAKDDAEWAEKRRQWRELQVQNDAEPGATA